jgi:hypothetical protein
MIFWTIFLVWFIVGIGCALILIKKSARILFWGAIGLTLYGGLAAVDSIRQGGFLNNAEFEFAGQGLLLFYSVLGGALISVALAEIRKDSANQN